MAEKTARRKSSVKSVPSLPPEIIAERATLMRALHPVVQMLGGIVGTNIEIVLHDLTQPASSIVAIANGHISNRAAGSSIISGPTEDRAFLEAKKVLNQTGEVDHAVITGYPTVTRGGVRLKSSTVVFRDSRGDPYAALCLNADMTMFHATLSWLESYLSVVPKASGSIEPQPAMEVLMQEIIDDAVRRTGKPLSMMSKDEKIQAVQGMLQRGLFIVKGGVERAAEALGVTRFTIYNYMEVLRIRGVAEEANFPKGMTRGVAKAPRALPDGRATAAPRQARGSRRQAKAA